jgi:hypothetical protein
VNGREFLTELVERVHALSLNPRNLVANKICQGTQRFKKIIQLSNALARKLACVCVISAQRARNFESDCTSVRTRIRSSVQFSTVSFSFDAEFLHS